MRKLLIVSILALLVLPASAEPLPGTTVKAFIQSCDVMLQNPKGANDGADACGFYMAGVGDAFTSHLLQPFACAPAGVGNMDVIRAFVDWARRNPEHHGQHVFRGVVAALKEAYPCR